MSIEFACPECQQKYRVKEELAGKSAKCAKCNHRMKVPEPVLVDDFGLDDNFGLDDELGNWMDDELSDSSTPIPAVSPSTSSGLKCSACGSSLEAGANICVSCGFDLRSGRKHTTQVETEENSTNSVVSQTASLGKGVIFSAIGAAVGAAVWVVVVNFTGYEIGWIAWGLGFAAGAGMAFGHEDNDGTMAGIIAGAISILGIVGAKFVIFEQLKSDIAAAGVTLEALEAFTGESITFGSLFGPIDGLFILLAVASAYKIGSGQVTD